MRKLPPIVVAGLCLLLAGCQTPLFSNGLFSSLSPNKTLTTQNTTSDSSRSVSATKPRVGGRGWRNASTRNAEKETQTQVAKLNNVGRLREFLAKGNDAMQQGLFDDARIQYETVLSIEPHHATAHHMLGRISDMSKKFPDAERHYLEALSANREDGYLLSDLGYSYLQQGRLDEARQYLMQAVSREPDLAIAKVNLAAVYAYNGDQRGAMAWLNQVGTPEQAQETLQSILSKPAPYVFNGAAGSLANNDKYTISQDGQVLDENGNALTTFDQIKEAMGELKDAARKKQAYESQVQTYNDDARIRGALGQQAFTGSGAGNRPLDGSRLNSQIQEIEQASGNDARRPRNSGPIYVGPPGQNNGPARGNVQSQYPPQYPPQNNRNTGNGNAPQQSGWNSHGQVQQFQPGQPTAPQDPYSHLLNPAGPSGTQPQPMYSNQQVPQAQSNMYGSSVPPQFPGSPPAQTHSPNALTVPQQQPHPHPQQQQQFQNPILDNRNGLQRGQPPGLAPPSANAVPRDQYGNPIQSSRQGSPAWNSQPGNVQPAQGSTAPNPDYFGQNNLQQDAGPQSGFYATSHPPALQQQQPAGQVGQQGQYPNGNGYPSDQPAAPYQGQFNQAQVNQAQSPNGWNNPQQQPIQQLGFDAQRPMARIDRGQRLQPYSDADRQAMQLGMAAGSGALSPIDTTQSQTPQSNQSFRNNSSQGDGRPYNATPYNATPNNATPYNATPNNVVPNGGPPQPSAVAPTNSGFNDDQSRQYPQQSQRMPDRGYPGAVPANSGQLPGQTGIQAPTRQIHGQSISDQLGQDPQTAQPWLRMPTSQADVTMPVAFSDSTQPTEQQSPNWQRPNLANQAWQNGVLASPTTQPGFGQPHMTNPYLRPPGTESGQPTANQEVQNVSWGSQQPISAQGRN